MPVPGVFDASQPFENGNDGALDRCRIVAVLPIEKPAAHQSFYIRRANFDHQTPKTSAPAIEQPPHPDGAWLVAASGVTSLSPRPCSRGFAMVIIG